MPGNITEPIFHVKDTSLCIYILLGYSYTSPFPAPGPSRKWTLFALCARHRFPKSLKVAPTGRVPRWLNPAPMVGLPELCSDPLAFLKTLHRFRERANTLAI